MESSAPVKPWHRHYDPGVPVEPRFEPRPVHDYLAQSVRDYPDANALVFLNCRMSYRELGEQVARCASALAQLGVTKGSRVAIQLPNLPQTVIAFYATLSLGAQAVMTNPLYVEREIEHQWRDADCLVAVVADYLYERRIRHIAGRLPVRHYVVASIPDHLRFPLNLLAPFKLRRARPPLAARVRETESVHHMRRLLATARPAPRDANVTPDDIAVLQYTGGTTGVSKGAMLTHANLSCNIQQVGAWFDARPGHEVMLGCLPFFHVFGLTVTMAYAVSVAASIVIEPDPRNMPQLMRSIARHRVTIFPGVPAMFNAMANVPEGARVDLTSIRSCFSGSAPLPPDVLERFERVTGAKIVEGYGLTEAGPVTHANPLYGERRAGSIGVPVPGTDMKIVSIIDGHTELPPGQAGELLVRGPQVMAGYWRQPEETAAVLLADGWLRTGDLATTDDAGYCFIVGRKKDMIIAGGYNVYPDEIDAVLMAHPAVLEAATIGVPDARRGETVKSFVVRRAGQQASAEDLIAHARTQLAAYKVPREVEFLDELPKSSVLKVLRRELRERELARARPPVAGASGR